MKLLSLEPESSASANSAIPAYKQCKVHNAQCKVIYPFIFTRSRDSEEVPFSIDPQIAPPLKGNAYIIHAFLQKSSAFLKKEIFFGRPVWVALLYQYFFESKARSVSRMDSVAVSDWLYTK